MEIKIGTRGSKLAVWQAEYVREELQKIVPEMKIEIIKIATKGDKILNAPLSRIGGKGLFTKEIEKKLMSGEIDIAVHSLKDMPVEMEEGLEIVAITEREEPLDALVSNKYKTFEEIPAGGKIGTSSLRRRVQILARREDLKIKELRGNVETRLKKLDAGEFDGIILAAAGLSRLGYEKRIREKLKWMIPAVGQGALAIETSKKNEEVKKIVKLLENEKTRHEIKAERAFLKEIGGSCQIPVGVYGKIEGKKITVEAVIASLDGKKIYREKIAGEIKKSAELGKNLALKLLKSGGDKILKNLLQEF